eukprot:1462634-Rhodomonas_salina.2
MAAAALPGVHCIKGVSRLLTGTLTSQTWTGSTLVKRAEYKISTGVPCKFKKSQCTTSWSQELKQSSGPTSK